MYIRYQVKQEDSAFTAEQILRKRLRFSGSLCRRMKKQESLFCNGQFILHGSRVKEGDVLEVNFKEEEEWEVDLPNPENLEIPYQDEWFALVSKPSGLPTHPRFPGDPGLTTAFEPAHVHPVNRLDLDTSGLTIIAKNPYAQDLLSQTPICKIYIALVHGKLKGNGFIDAPIDRAPDSIILREVADTGKRAVTHFAALQFWEKSNVSLVAFRLETGRTHQIRVHCQWNKHPIVGDTLYGWEQSFRAQSEIRGRNRANYLMKDDRDFWDSSQKRDFLALELNRLLGRQFLHAEELRFTHPITHNDIEVMASLPNDLKRVLEYINAKEKPVAALGCKEDLYLLTIEANNIQ